MQDPLNITRAFSLPAFLLSLLSLVFPSMAQVVLVEDGRPRAVIVVEDNDKAAHAAAAIQKYVAKMSGATLPIVKDGEPIEGGPNLVLVGHTAKAKELGVVIPSGYDPTVRDDAFEEEGFALKTMGNHVVVGGNNDGQYRGTIYAAYELLRTLGCRFYFPGEWGEVIPQAATVAVPAVDVTSKPDFPVRSISLSGWVPVTAEEREIYADWCDKVGFNPAPMYPAVGDGFLAFLLPPSEYFDAHPEYFAIDESGQRNVNKARPRFAMLCLSNPDVFSESVKNLRAAFAGEKEMRNVADNGFGISPPDGTPYCFCDNCKSQSQNFRYPTYTHRTTQSEEFFGFAARLAREFPDKFASTMAYALREWPPQGVDIPSNMMVMYAPISCDVLHANDSKLWRRAEFVSMLKQWRQRTPHVTIYDYNPGFLTGFFVPERDTANMAVNAPIYREIDIKGMAREGRKAFMQTWISYYATAALLWDADTDVAALKRDFYTTFFGPDAGPHVQAWWDACEEQLVNAAIQAHEDFLINHLYDLPFVQRIRPHVDAALAAPATQQQKERLAAFALIADHLEAFAAMTDAEQRMDWAAASDAAQRMTDDKLKLSEIYSFFIHVNPESRRPFFAEGRKRRFDLHLARTSGEQGTLVAELPLVAKFIRDPFNEGVIGQWYLPDHDDSGWETRNTFFLWDQQEEFLDDKGHDYDGYGWYRMTVDIPASFTGKPIHLHLGGVINEGWVWVNGRYAGHKAHELWWSHQHEVDLDITGLVTPGSRATIAVRVWNDAEPGGLYRRGYVWSPRE